MAGRSQSGLSQRDADRAEVQIFEPLRQGAMLDKIISAIPLDDYRVQAETSGGVTG